MAWPLIIWREFGLESRRPWTYWSRATAGSLVVLTLLSVFTSTGISAAQGQELFSRASIVVVLGLWVLCPLLAADSLSGEKREGTLDLLLLTYLTHPGLVTAKAVGSATRAAGLAITAVPVLTTAVMIGGVTGEEVLVNLFHELGVLFYSQLGPLLLRKSALAAAIPLLVSVGLLIGCILLAAGLLGQGRRPGRLAQLIDRLRHPARAGIDSARARPCSVADPLSWVLQRSSRWQVRKWGWAAGALGAAALSLDASWEGNPVLLISLGLGLAMSFAGASSFTLERQNGALELLLVTPLSEDQLLGGQLRTLWKQFGPAVLIILLTSFGSLFWHGCDLLGPHWRVASYSLLLFTSFLMLPPLGMYFSLHQRTFLGSWLWTCFLAGVIPIVTGLILFAEPPRDSSEVWIAALLQLGISFAAIRYLREGIDRRSFCGQGKSQAVREG
jgi:hypothetical protein